MPYGINEVNYALKQVYPAYPPEDVAGGQNKFLSMVNKEGIWTGKENMPQAVEHGYTQSGGGDFALAQAQSSSTLGKEFSVPKRWAYWFAKIDGKAIVATSDAPKSAFFKAVKHETDNGIKAFGDHLAICLSRTGTGSLGQRSGALSGNIVTLSKKGDVRNFRVGMTIQASSTDGASGLRTGSAVVIRLDHGAGTIELDNAAGITTFTAGDFLARQGDFDNTATGVQAWIPLASPGTSDNFLGVNRSVDRERLAGQRLPAAAASNSIKENAMDISAAIDTFGGFTKGKGWGFLSPANWNRLQKDLDAQIRRNEGPNGRFGFRYIEQDSPAGTIEWYSERTWPDDLGHVLDPEMWVVRHALGYPHLNEDDGNSALRSSNSDAIEVRLRSAGNLFMLGGSRNGVFPITPP